MTQHKERTLEIKVGALIVLTIALVVFFLFLLGSFSFQRTYKLKVDFDFSGNLQVGAPVKISGIKMGKVEEVDFLGGKFDPNVNRHVQVRVTLQVNDKAKDAVHEDAEFFINTQGVLGEQYLEIEPGDATKPILAPGSIRRGVDPPRTDLIVARLYEFLDSLTNLIRSDKDVIRDFLASGASTLRTLDSVLNNNQDQIGRLLRDMDRVTADADLLIVGLRKGLGDPTTIARTLANIESVTATLKRDLDPLIQKTRHALESVENVTSIVGQTEKKKLARTLDQLVTFGDRADAIANDAQFLVSNMRRGRGTVGALLVDQQIYDDLKELVRDLKRNPWKFLWKD